MQKLLNLLRQAIEAIGPAIKKALSPLFEKYPAAGEFLEDAFEAVATTAAGAIVADLFSDASEKTHALLGQIRDRLSEFHADVKFGLGLAGDEQGPPLPSTTPALTPE